MTRNHTGDNAIAWTKTTQLENIQIATEFF